MGIKKGWRGARGRTHILHEMCVKLDLKLSLAVCLLPYVSTDLRNPKSEDNCNYRTLFSSSDNFIVHEGPLFVGWKGREFDLSKKAVDDSLNMPSN